MGVKKCLNCKRDKPLESFTKDRKQPDGLYVYCRSCQAAMRKMLSALDVARQNRRQQKERCMTSYDEAFNALEAEAIASKVMGVRSIAYSRLFSATDEYLHIER